MTIMLLYKAYISTIVEIYKVYMTIEMLDNTTKSTIVEIYKVYMTWQCCYKQQYLQ